MEQGSQPMLAASVRALFDPGPADALAVWCESKPCSIDLVNSLAGGRTKAKLAVVNLIDDSKGARTAVLKHCPADPYRQSRDYLAFKNAANSGPENFANSHLVGLDEGIKDPIPDGHSGQFLIMRHLGPGQRRYYSTLADLLDSSALGSACKTIMPQILIEWNNQPGLPTHKREGVTAQEFLREILGERCDPGGHLRGVIDGLTEPGHELRWPLAAVASGDKIAHVRMKGLRGNAHGDLHPDNVFIPIPNIQKSSEGDYKDFALIDLTTFGSARLLAVDPAHLAMSIIARMLPELSPKAMNRLADFVLDPDSMDPAGIPGQLAAAIKAIHNAGMKFADARSDYTTWDLERLAAIAACALLFVGREQDDTGREKDDKHPLWFLRLAAEALKRLSGASPDPAGDPAKRPGSPEHQGTGGPPPDPPGEDPRGGMDHDRRSLWLVPDDASLPSASPAEDGAASASPAGDGAASICVSLADELIRELRDLSDHLSPSEAETATTTARVIAEDLSEALDGLPEAPEGRRISDITAIGMARATFDEVQASLQAMREHGVNPLRLRALSAKAEQLLRRMAEIEKAGNPNQSPGP